MHTEIREIRIRPRLRHCKFCPCDAQRRPRSPVSSKILVTPGNSFSVANLLARRALPPEPRCTLCDRADLRVRRVFAPWGTAVGQHRLGAGACSVLSNSAAKVAQRVDEGENFKLSRTRTPRGLEGQQRARRSLARARARTRSGGIREQTSMKVRIQKIMAGESVTRKNGRMGEWHRAARTVESCRQGAKVKKGGGEKLLVFEQKLYQGKFCLRVR